MSEAKSMTAASPSPVPDDLEAWANDRLKIADDTEAAAIARALIAARERLAEVERERDAARATAGKLFNEHMALVEKHRAALSAEADQGEAAVAETWREDFERTRAEVNRALDAGRAKEPAPSGMAEREPSNGE